MEIRAIACLRFFQGIHHQHIPVPQEKLSVENVWMGPVRAIPLFNPEGTHDFETGRIGLHQAHIPSFLLIHIEHAIGKHHFPF